MTKRIFITFCAAAACCVLLGACESGSLAAAAGKRTRPADLGELQFITPAEGDPIATLSTTLGDISFVLYPDIAPMAVENFVGLAQQGYYNGLSFHRVIEGFLVQTGDATGTGAGGSTIWNGNSYPNEISDRLHHYAGAVAMAHAPDGASGNLSQFYIVQSAQDSVDKTLAKTLTEAGVREAVVTAYQAVGGAPYLDNLNTVFGQVGVQLASDLLVQMACSFGFNEDIPFDLPLATSLMPDPEEMTTWETAWAAAGEPVNPMNHESPAGPQATVLQMAMVGNAIANDGVEMKPYLVDGVYNANGQRSFTAQPEKLRTSISADTAKRVRDILKGVVKQGTGTAAQINGVEVAGKTGTAEKANSNDSWFVGMAPADNAGVVVAVVIEDGDEGVGTQKAHDILQTALEVQGLI